MYPLTIGLAVDTKALRDEVRASLQALPVRVVLEEEEIGAFLDGLEHLRPDVVLVDLGTSPDRVEQVVRRMRTSGVQPMVIAVHTSAEPEIILAALRAGANEYVFPPLAGTLQQALERLSQERETARGGVRGKGKSIALLSAKGGCGATTIACHVAVELARRGNRHTLLADLDMNVGMIRFLMRSTSTYSVLDAVNNLRRLDLNYWKALVSNGSPGLEVIAAPPALPAIRLPEPEQLRHVLSFARSHYDWTVVDLGRNLTLLAMTVFEEIDEVFLVATLDVPALHQAKLIVNSLADSDYGKNRIRLILNRAPARPDIPAQDVEKMLGHPIYAMLPDESAALFDAFCEGKLLAPSTSLGKQLARLACKIAGIPEEKGRSRFSIWRRGDAGRGDEEKRSEVWAS